MFSVEAEPTVSGGLRGNYVASVGRYAPECLQGLELRIGLGYTALMTDMRCNPL